MRAGYGRWISRAYQSTLSEGVGVMIGHRTRRSVVGGAVVVALILGGTARIEADAPPTIPRDISATGSGSALTQLQVARPLLIEVGSYSSTGQLGSGRYEVFTHPEPGCSGNTALVDGSAKITRSDGARLTGTATGCNTGGLTGTSVLHLSLTSGTRDLRHGSLTLSTSLRDPVRAPGGNSAVETVRFTGTVAVAPRVGYWILDAIGNVATFGGPDQLGPVPTSCARHIAATPTGAGIWVADCNGEVIVRGDARRFGSMGGKLLSARVVGMAPTPNGGGYWLVASDGGVFRFGNARFFGSMGGTPLRAPVVGISSTPDGGGYWLVASDGGVFRFGNARFFGSMGATPMNGRVVGIASTRDGGGYWLAASDGGVFAFGNAPFRGSRAGARLNAPIVGVSRYGPGYVLAGRDGGIFNFGGGPFMGSMAGATHGRPVVSIAAVN